MLTTCTPGMFTGMQMAEWREVEAAAEEWLKELLLGWEEGIGASGLAVGGCDSHISGQVSGRQAQAGLPARGIFSSATTSPGSLAMTFPFINSKSEWNRESRSQKTLLLSLEEVQTKQYRERKGKQAP